MYERNGTGIETRYKLLTANHEYVSQRPDAFLQEIQAMLLYGESQKAIDYLVNNFFPRQEGVDNLHGIYVDACLLQGITELNSNNYENALEYFLIADKYPSNHQIARNSNYERNVQILYYEALTYEKLNKTNEASSLLRKVRELEIKEPKYKFYQALAYKKSGNKKYVELITREIEEKGNKRLSNADEEDFFSKFGEGQSENVRQSEGNYLLGLSNLIRGNKEDAREYLEKPNQLNPNDLWVKINLNISESK